MTLPVTIRLADTADAGALRRLAQLDTSFVPPGPHLVAELDGGVEAAVSISTGAVVANPFVRTAETCDLLRHAAAAARGRREPARRRKPIRTRPLPAPA
jgi:hypothetical protein